MNNEPKRVKFLEIKVSNAMVVDPRSFSYYRSNQARMTRATNGMALYSEEVGIEEIEVPIHRLCRMYKRDKVDPTNNTVVERYIAISRDMQKDVFDPIINPALDRADEAEQNLRKFTNLIARMNFWQKLKFLFLGNLPND